MRLHEVRHQTSRVLVDVCAKGEDVSARSTRGGHPLAGEAWPTSKLIITEVASELAKRVDPETGLALMSSATH